MVVEVVAVVDPLNDETVTNVVVFVVVVVGDDVDVFVVDAVEDVEIVVVVAELIEAPVLITTSPRQHSEQRIIIKILPQNFFLTISSAICDPCSFVGNHH